MRQRSSKKPLKFAVASLVALGLIVVLSWKPVIQAEQR